MSQSDLAKTIDTAFENRAEVNTGTKGAVRDAVEQALELLDSGKQRVAEKEANGTWRVNQWLKKAVLLSFRLSDNSIIPGAGKAGWWDKVPLKAEGWGENRFRDAGFRAVPGSVVRRPRCGSSSRSARRSRPSPRCPPWCRNPHRRRDSRRTASG